MASKSAPIYANVVQIRLTDNELVFEFGSHFPDKGADQAPPSDYVPDVRVVLRSGVMEAIVQALSKTFEERQEANAEGSGTSAAPKVDIEVHNP